MLFESGHGIYRKEKKMTNAEKYKEVFGMEPAKECCPTSSCSDCPGKLDDHGLCTFNFWNKEYEGGES